MIGSRTALLMASSALAGLCELSTTRAWAVDAEVTSTTAAQGYSLRSPWGDPILQRRRYLQTLGLQVTNLEGDDTAPGDPQVSFRMRVRLDADFGIGWDEAHLSTTNRGVFIPGLEQEPVDLMYGYLEARNLARGLLTVRLGRQYVIDPLGWWSFDGVLNRVQLPAYLAFETYGGLEQRGGLPLSSPRYERDGVWRGDRTGLDAATYPEFLSASVAPAYGLSVESAGLKYLHARVSYRKVWNTGTVATRSTLDSPSMALSTTGGWRTSSERIGASTDVLIDELGSARAGLIYDAYSQLIASSYGSIDVFAAPWLTVGSDIDRYVPTFDADSIWNWFVHNPMTTWTGRVDATLGKRLEMGASGGMRMQQADQGDGTTVRSFDKLGRLSARTRWGAGVAGASTMLERGDSGRREGCDLYAEHTVEKRYLMMGRLSLYDWRDELRPDRSATSVGYVLGAGYRVGPPTQVLVEWEHNSNRLVGQRYRVMALLAVVIGK